MTSASLQVLLLGWNDAPRSGEQPVPPIQPLIHTLAPHAALSVMLPQAPQPAIPVTPGTQVTALASLSEAEARAPRPGPDERPAAWHHRPAAPYVGTAEDAGLPGTASPAAPANPAPTAPRVGALSLPYPPAPASISPTTHANAAHPTTDDTPADAPDAATTPDQSNLLEALSVLGADMAPDADLNFQVIQYARFATRRALLEDFAVIYAVDWPTWLAALEIRQQTGRPLVLHVHSLAQERATPADRGWALELERLVLRRADLVLAASEELAQRLRQRYQLAAGRLRVVAPTDTETVNDILHRLENSLTGRQPVVPFFPPTA